MRVRRVVTGSSIWTFNLDSRMCTRVPRSEDPSHPAVPYSEVGKPFEFTLLKPLAPLMGARSPLLVVVVGRGPVTTGPPIEDSAPNLWLPERPQDLEV